MRPSAQLTSEQLKDIIQDKKKTDQGATEAQEQVDGEDVLDLADTSSVLNTVLNTINNEFEHECLAKAVSLLNARPLCQSTDDRVSGHKYSIPGLELSFWHTRFGPSRSLCGWGFGMLIWQEHWWKMKWVLERLSPRWQQQ